MQRLGQHFLKNKEILRKIADELDIQEKDTVIEIGPGHGELTEELRTNNPELRIIAIEKDNKLAEELKGKFAADNKIQIVDGDALRVLPSIIHNSSFIIQRYKLVGNIPYYITGYLLRILGELDKKPEKIVLLVQKEVAERVCALPPRMNLLAASVQIWASPKIIRYVGKKDFTPPPEVDSAIISLSPRTEADLTHVYAENYYRFIKVLFKQPRKTILNNIVASSKHEVSSMGKEEIEALLKKSGVDPKGRPQDLSVEKIKELAEVLR